MILTARSDSNDEIARVDVYDLANAGCNFLSTHCSSDLTLSKDSNGPYYTVTPPCIIDEFQCQATCSLAGGMSARLILFSINSNFK